MSATRSRARASGSDASASDNEFGMDDAQLEGRFILSDVAMLAWMDLELTNSKFPAQFQVLARTDKCASFPEGGVTCRTLGVKSASKECTHLREGLQGLFRQKRPGTHDPTVSFGGRQWAHFMLKAKRVRPEEVAGKKRAMQRQAPSECKTHVKTADSDVSLSSSEASLDGPRHKDGMSSAETDSVCSMETESEASSTENSRLPKANAARKKRLEASGQAESKSQLAGHAYTQSLVGVTGRRAYMIRASMADESGFKSGKPAYEKVRFGNAQEMEGVPADEQRVEIIPTSSDLPSNFPKWSTGKLLLKLLSSQRTNGDVTGASFKGVCKRSGEWATFKIGEQVADIDYECQVTYDTGNVLNCEVYTTSEIDDMKTAADIVDSDEMLARKMAQEDEDDELLFGVELTAEAIDSMSWSDMVTQARQSSATQPASSPQKQKQKPPGSPAKAAASQPKQKQLPVPPEFQTQGGRVQCIAAASRIVSVKAKLNALSHMRTVFGQMRDQIDSSLKLFMPEAQRFRKKEELWELGVSMDEVDKALSPPPQASTVLCSLQGCSEPVHLDPHGGYFKFCCKRHGIEHAKVLGRRADELERQRRHENGPQPTEPSASTVQWGPPSGPSSEQPRQKQPPPDSKSKAASEKAAPPATHPLERFPYLHTLMSRVDSDTYLNHDMLDMLLKDMCEALEDPLPRHVVSGTSPLPRLEFLELQLAEFEREGASIDTPDSQGWCAVAFAIGKWAKDHKKRGLEAPRLRGQGFPGELSGDSFANVLGATMANAMSANNQASALQNGMQIAGMMNTNPTVRADGTKDSADQSEEKHCALRSFSTLFNADSSFTEQTAEAQSTMAKLTKLDSSRAASMRDPEDAAAAQTMKTDCAALGSALISQNADADRVFAFEASNQLGITSGSPLSLAKSTKETATHALARVAADILHVHSAVPREGQADMEKFTASLKQMLRFNLDLLNEKDLQGVGSDKGLFTSLTTCEVMTNRRELSNDKWLASSESAAYAAALSLSALLEKAQALMQPIASGTLWGEITELLSWGRRMRVAPLQIGMYLQEVFSLFERERKQFKTGFNPIRPSAKCSWYHAACQNQILKERLAMIRAAVQLKRYAEEQTVTQAKGATQPAATVVADTNAPLTRLRSEPVWLNPANGEVVPDKAAAIRLQLWPPSAKARKAATLAGKAVYCTPDTKATAPAAGTDARLGSVGQAKPTPNTLTQTFPTKKKGGAKTQAAGSAQTVLNPHISPNPSAEASAEITAAWSSQNMTFEAVPRRKCWWYWVRGECAKGSACKYVHG